MKRLKVFAMLLCIAVLGLTTSCSKDDEDLIVGKWKLIYAARVVVQVDGYTGHVNRISGTTDEQPLDSKWQFTKEGELYQWLGESCEHQDRYVVRDGYLVLSKDEDMFWVKKYQIEKLTKKNLILSYNYAGDTPDHDAEYTEKIWVEFEKD